MHSIGLFWDPITIPCQPGPVHLGSCWTAGEWGTARDLIDSTFGAASCGARSTAEIWSGWWIDRNRTVVKRHLVNKGFDDPGRSKSYRWIITYLGGGFKYFLFSSLFGKMIEFDEYFSKGLKPPTIKKTWPKSYQHGSCWLYRFIFIFIPCIGIMLEPTLNMFVIAMTCFFSALNCWT